MNVRRSLDSAGNGIRFELTVVKMRGFSFRRPGYALFDRFLRDLKRAPGTLFPSKDFVRILSGPPCY